MRIKNSQLLYFRLFCTVATLLAVNGLQAQSDSTASVIVTLSGSQKDILYKYALLEKNASALQAETYFQQFGGALPAMSLKLRNAIAEEIFAHTQLLYAPERSSPIRLWMQAQTFTQWMLYLAAILATFALLRILYIYSKPIKAFLIRQFASVFRLLFSRFLLTIELLVIGAGCVAGGVFIADMTLRIILVHTGIFLIWTQCTALFTREYLAMDYSKYVINTLKENNISKIFRTVFFPSVITLVALVYIIYRLPADSWYYWEVVVVGLVSIYTLPPVKKLEYYFSPVLLLFYKDGNTKTYSKPLAHYTVFTFLVTLAAALFLPVWLKPCGECLNVLVIILLILLSTIYDNYNNKLHFIYLQLITIAYVIFVLCKGRRDGSEMMIWQAIIGANLFVVIKYWQTPVVLWDMNWRKNKIWWGLLGMGALLWLLAQGTQLFLHHFISLPPPF